jgi:hypothetical protein
MGGPDSRWLYPIVGPPKGVDHSKDRICRARRYPSIVKSLLPLSSFKSTTKQ